MPNIFDGLENLDDNIVVDYIAMLETATMGSVIKGYGTTVANKSAKTVNSIGNFFGKNFDVKVVKEKGAEDYINEKRDEIKYLNRQQLDKIFASVLKDKVSISGEASQDYISARTILLKMKIFSNIKIIKIIITQNYLESHILA